MPLFTRIGYLIGGALSVAVFGTAIIGTNYQGVILSHLADVINGSNTQTVVSLNAPNWADGIPLATPAAIASATTTGGTMASSTTEYFAVSALDGFGTTTVSNTVSATTDPASSGLGAEAYEITWSPVSGSTGYAIYFGSSATTLNNYFIATTSGAYYMASTTSGALTGSYTKSDTTAFASKINPLGASYLDGGALSIGGGLTQGLPINSTTTLGTSQTLAASDIVSGIMNMTPNTGALTLTLPASSTLASFLPTQGQKTTFTIYNATGTTAATITVSAGTGETIEHATSSAIRAGDIGTLEFLRLPSSNLLVFYNTGF